MQRTGDVKERERVCVFSGTEGARVARGRGQLLPDDVAVGGRVQRHDDAVTQLPAAVHG